MLSAAGAWGAPSAWAITDKEEAQMAAGMGPALAERMGGTLPASDPMAQRVERIGKRFAHLARPRSFGYRYRVLKNSTILNAFAAPGGTIYITTRLVKFTRSEDELASILGHETAHVSQRHIAQEVEERNSFVRFSARLAQLRREAAQNPKGSKNSKSKAAAKSSAKNGSGEMASSSPWPTLTWFLLSRGRSRELESEADAVSVRWMKRLGYNPRASISLLEHADSALPHSSSPLGSLLASHPGTTERVQALREQIDREKLDIAPRPAAPKPTPSKVPEAKPDAKAPQPAGPAADGAPTTAASDVAAAAAAGKAPPAKPGDAPVAP